MFPRIPGAVGGGGPCGDFGECGCERRCCSWCCRAASVVFAVRGAAFTGDVFAALAGGVRCLGFLLPVRFVLAMLFLLLVRSLLFLLPVRSLLFLGLCGLCVSLLFLLLVLFLLCTESGSCPCSSLCRCGLCSSSCRSGLCSSSCRCWSLLWLGMCVGMKCCEP